MYKIILITFVLSYTVCEHSNGNVHKIFQEFPKAKEDGEVEYPNNKIRLLNETKDLDVDEDDIKNKSTPKLNINYIFFKYKKFQEEIKQYAIIYSKKLNQKHITKEELNVVTNRFAGEIISKLKVVIQRNLEPLSLLNIEKSFKYKILIITATGHLQLTHGRLRNLSNIEYERSVVTPSKEVHIVIPLHIDKMEFEFDFAAALLGIGPNGKVKGTVKNVRADLILVVNTKRSVITKAKFTLKKQGEIEFKLQGGLIHKVLNMLRLVSGFFIDRFLLNSLDDQIKREVAVVNNNVNEILKDFVNIK